jgi:hypothetical protein
MELPNDVLMLIREYSGPCTRPDWRKGSSIMHQCPLSSNFNLDICPITRGDYFKLDIYEAFCARYYGTTEEDDDAMDWFV